MMEVFMKLDHWRYVCPQTELGIAVRIFQDFAPARVDFLFCFSR
jgi:hypothetical protein